MDYALWTTAGGNVKARRRMENDAGSGNGQRAVWGAPLGKALGRKFWADFWPDSVWGGFLLQLGQALTFDHFGADQVGWIQVWEGGRSEDAPVFVLAADREVFAQLCIELFGLLFVALSLRIAQGHGV